MNNASETSLETATASLASGVADAVVKRIHGGGLVVGDRLPSEGELALEFGVSRGVIREAFKALEALGVLELAPGKRAQVGRIKSSVLATLMNHAVVTMQSSVYQTFDLRRTLEMRTARLAALRRTEADLNAIRSAAVAMRREFVAGDLPTDHDIEFHLAIARATQNPLYALLIESFRLVIQQTAPVSWAARSADDERRAVLDLHDAIVDAIAARDAASAELAMANHFDSSVQALMSAGVT